MSVVKRIIQDSIERVKVDELLLEEYEQAGYGGITLTKTPLGAQINLFAMRPGRVIGKRGRAIKAASARLEDELGLSNPQITVVEVEVPEMNPQIMASRIANALERGVHYRRAIFWSLRRIIDSGAIGCEVLLKGPLRSARSRFEKVVEGYVPKSGDPALRHVRTATIHVKMKRGVIGVTVKIVPPEAKFPDKVELDNLPEIEYEPPIPVEPETPEEEAQSEAEKPEPEEAEQAEQPVAPETDEPKETADVEKKPAADEATVEEVKEDSIEEEPEAKPEATEVPAVEATEVPAVEATEVPAVEAIEVPAVEAPAEEETGDSAEEEPEKEDE